MDLEETVKELKADLKNARELISCLTETVKVQKGRDEDLHRKLDELLKGKENQMELEKKIEALREETMAIAEDVKKSKQIADIIDTVQTTEGYVELFVKDFETIQAKQDETSYIIGQNFMETKHQANLESSQIRETLEQMGDLFVKKAAEIKLEIQNSFQKEFEKMNEIETKCGKMKDDFAEMKKLIEKELFLTKFIKQQSKDEEKQKLQNNSSFFAMFSKSKPEVELQTNSQESGNTSETYADLFGKDFQYIVTKNDDIEALLKKNFFEIRSLINSEFKKSGEKVEAMEETVYRNQRSTIHQLQLDSDRSSQIEEKIDDIGDQLKELTENWKSIATKVENIEEGQKGIIGNARKPTQSKVEVKKTRTVTSSKFVPSKGETKAMVGNRDTVFKCRNCLSILPENLLLEHDGVSVKCPKWKCGCHNELWKPIAGHKWMKGICGHVCAFPLNFVTPTNTQCLNCGLKCQFTDQKTRTAVETSL